MHLVSIPIHKGVVRRRSVDGVGKAAPALVPRTHESGRPRVTVRPYYEGLPLVGLDAGRMKAAKAAGSGERMLLSVPGSTVPRFKIAAVECRKACALRKRALL